MKTLSIYTAVLIGFFVANNSVVFSQQASKLDSVLSDFKSPDKQRREDAYYSIKDNEDALRQPRVQNALFDLLDRENQVYDDPKASYGEGYIEYVGDLGETIGSFADWHDSRQVCVLAQSSGYQGSGGHLTGLATQLVIKAGKLALPCLLRMAHGSPGERDSAVTVLLKVSAVTPDLSPSDRQQILKAVMDGLRDPAPGVRLATVMASETLGTPELIPVLQELTRSDPYTDRPGTGYFPIREAAVKAILAIQKRGQAK
jgi:hypothetical protein